LACLAEPGSGILRDAIGDACRVTEGKKALPIIDKLPQLDDAALAVLQGNAERLVRVGTKTQQADAIAILPAIEAERAARRDAKATQAKATAAAKREAAKKGKGKS
jgi:hypothetical protein